MIKAIVGMDAITSHTTYVPLANGTTSHYNTLVSCTTNHLFIRRTRAIIRCNTMTKPTNFLSLPHELRQDILFRSLHGRIEPKYAPPVFYSRCTIPKSIQDWAVTLQEAAPDILDNVDSVEEKWLEDLDVVWQAERPFRFRASAIERAFFELLGRKTGRYGLLTWFADELSEETKEKISRVLI